MYVLKSSVYKCKSKYTLQKREHLNNTLKLNEQNMPVENLY